MVNLAQEVSELLNSSDHGSPAKWHLLGKLVGEKLNLGITHLDRGHPGEFSLKNAQHQAGLSYEARRLSESNTQGYDSEQIEFRERMIAPLQQLFGIEIDRSDIFPISRGVEGIYRIARRLDKGSVFMSLPGYPNWIQAIEEVGCRVHGIDTLRTESFDVDPALIKREIDRAKNLNGLSAQTENISALLLFYMHNPRGTKLEYRLDKIAKIAKDNPEMPVIIDAAYLNDNRLISDENARGGRFAPDKTVGFHSPIAELINHYDGIRDQLVILSPTSKMADFDAGGGTIICPNPNMKSRLLRKLRGEAPNFGNDPVIAAKTAGVYEAAAGGGIAELSQHFKIILDEGANRLHKLGAHPGHKTDGGYYLMCWLDAIGMPAPELKQLNGKTKIENNQDLCLFLITQGLSVTPIGKETDTTGLIRLVATNRRDLNQGIDILKNVIESRQLQQDPSRAVWSRS